MKKFITITILFFLVSTNLVSYQGISKDIKNNSSFLESNVIDLIEQVNESLVKYYHNKLMQFAPRYTGTLNCALAGQMIFDEFEKMGLQVEFHEWRYAGYHSNNVIATLPGSDSDSDAIFLMSAHYDTVKVSPGADDDGSGVAAVLATAKILSQYSFNHTIQFIAFSGEEVGTYGSYFYAKKCYYQGDNIIAVINPDMVGYANSYDGGRIIRFFYPERSKWIADFASDISDKYIDTVDMIVEPLPNYIGADHQAFVYYGYDGVWISHRDGYPWGHSEEDSADKINWSYLVKATKFLLATMVELAIKPIHIQVIIKTPLEGYFYLFNKPLFELTFGRLWYLGLRGVTVIHGRAIASAEVKSNEDIERVIFCLDGDFMYWDSEPPYEWKIQGRFSGLVGKHVLKVYAYTKSGKIATDEMDIFIRTRSKMY